MIVEVERAGWLFGMPWDTTLWGGPADGKRVTVERCEHGDWPAIEIVIADHPGGSAWYALDETRNRYTYRGTS